LNTYDIFAAAIEDADSLLVPVICIYEVFKVILREKGEEEALQVVAAMQQGTVVDLDSDLAIEAASIGLQEKLAFADSVIFAASLRFDAILWTQDEHFAGKRNIQFHPKQK